MKISKYCLVDKSCVPCQGGIFPLTYKETEKLLKELESEWILNDIGHLYKEYSFKDFMEPIAFTNKVVVIAEEEAHHPDLKISWGMCAVEIWTHTINGLTENDSILAAKIDAIL